MRSSLERRLLAGLAATAGWLLAPSALADDGSRFFFAVSSEFDLVRTPPAVGACALDARGRPTTGYRCVIGIPPYTWT